MKEETNYAQEYVDRVENNPRGLAYSFDRWEINNKPLIDCRILNYWCRGSNGLWTTWEDSNVDYHRIYVQDYMQMIMFGNPDEKASETLAKFEQGALADEWRDRAIRELTKTPTKPDDN